MNFGDNTNDLNRALGLATSQVMPWIAFVVTKRISLVQIPLTAHPEKSLTGLSSGLVSNARMVKSRHPLLLPPPLLVFNESACSELRDVLTIE